MTIKARLGQLLLFIGLLGLVLFFATFLGQKPTYLFCLGGLSAILLGQFLIRKGKQAGQPSSRFRLVRSVRDKFTRNHENENEENR